MISLRKIFVEKNENFVNLKIFKFRFIWQKLVIEMASLAINIISTLLIKKVLEIAKFQFHSSQMNFKIFFLSLYEFLYSYPFSFFGFHKGVLEVRRELRLRVENIRVFFEYINSNWNSKALMLLIATFFKYIVFGGLDLIKKNKPIKTLDKTLFY